jgi:hypothetical protein
MRTRLTIIILPIIGVRISSPIPHMIAKHQSNVGISCGRARRPGGPARRVPRRRRDGSGRQLYAELGCRISRLILACCRCDKQCRTNDQQSPTPLHLHRICRQIRYSFEWIIPELGIQTALHFAKSSLKLDKSTHHECHRGKSGDPKTLEYPSKDKNQRYAGKKHDDDSIALAIVEVIHTANYGRLQNGSKYTKEQRNASEQSNNASSFHGIRYLPFIPYHPNSI